MLSEIFEPPLEWVLEREGVSLRRDGSKLLGICPFHSDSDPSFAMWRYNDRDFVGCWACGFGPTDAIGFIREKYSVSYAESLVIIRRIAKEMPEDWKFEPLPSTSVKNATRDFTKETKMSLTDDPTAAREFLELRGLGEDDEWLMEKYRFGGDHKYVVVPHYTPSGKHVTGLKYREVHGQLMTMEGGTLSFLYGSWLDGGQPFVVLCEGESDTWRVASFFREDPRVLVLGLPAGAKGPKLMWLNMLNDRKLMTIFDGDAAGRKATEEWLKVVPGLKAIDPGDDMDACKLTNEQLKDLIGS